MKRLICTTGTLLLVITPWLTANDDSQLDLRRAVPADVYLAVHGKHNPERDYQIPYLENVATAIRETKLRERLQETITKRLPDANRERTLALFQELATAVEPIDLHALLTPQEVIYAQRMESFPVKRSNRDTLHLLTSQHLVILRLTPEKAADYEQGFTNLFQIARDHSGGKISIKTRSADQSASVTSLCFPQGPYCPSLVRVDDTLLLSSSFDFLRQSLNMLLDGTGESKFDDPRVLDALQHLPDPEDALVVYDGRSQFGQMRSFLETIRGQLGERPEAERWLGFATSVFDEVAILDLIVSVEYTEGNHNCSETVGRLMPGFEDRLLAKMLDSGESFHDWQRWVPADVAAYSLSTGADFHPAYQYVMGLLRERLPEMHRPLDRFENWQREIDLHLDVDLLQAFSGECVSLTMPAQEGSGSGANDMFFATRCHKPARIRWLLDRVVDSLNQFPLIQMQKLRLVESETLEGFEEVSAEICGQFGVRPVIGFHEGWLILGSSSAAVQRVLDTRSGDAPNIAESEVFQGVHLDIEGPVQHVSFINLAEQIRQVASVCEQAGAVMPMVLGLAMSKRGDQGDANPLERLMALQVMAELLSDAGKVIGQFDFLESQFKVIQDGPEPGTWHERSVIVIRPPS